MWHVAGSGESPPSGAHGHFLAASSSGRESAIVCAYEDTVRVPSRGPRPHDLFQP